MAALRCWGVAGDTSRTTQPCKSHSGQTQGCTSCHAQEAQWAQGEGYAPLHISPTRTAAPYGEPHHFTSCVRMSAHDGQQRLISVSSLPLRKALPRSSIQCPPSAWASPHRHGEGIHSLQPLAPPLVGDRLKAAT
ncbi:hypothetical protein TRVL_07032 [Trypanosoma vivax]|nr:hypothetical protein TRVL_07032 [Trypanosoma vivax]